MALYHLKIILITLSFGITLMTYSQTTPSDNKEDNPPQGFSKNWNYYLVEYWIVRKSFCCKGNTDIDQPPYCCSDTDTECCFGYSYEYPRENERSCKPKGCYTRTTYNIPAVFIGLIICTVIGFICLRKMHSAIGNGGLVDQEEIPLFPIPRLAWGTDDEEDSDSGNGE